MQDHHISVPNDFVLLRILGNDLPPRHEAGQTVRNLRFALKNEQPLAGCIKVWILNRIVCPSVEAALIDLLEQHGERYDRIPFEADAYRRVGWSFAHTSTTGYLLGDAWAARPEPEQQRILEKVYEFKNRYVMNCNGARNHALTLGRSLARWVLPFDGNCFFTASAWDRLRADVLAHPELPYFIVPMARVIDNAALLDPNHPFSATHEPQIVFRSDAREAFDERYRYGTRPKVELLMRLGVPGVWDGLMIDPWEPVRPDPSPEAGRFAPAGWVARLSSGCPEQEGAAVEATRARNLARRSAILSMIDGVDERLLREDLEAGTPPSAREGHDDSGRYEEGREAPELRDDDPTPLRAFLDDVCALALAWTRTGDAQEADRAAVLVRSWFVDADTRTDPRPSPAAVRTGDQATPIGTERLHRFVRAIHLLRQVGALSDRDAETFQTWLRHRDRLAESGLEHSTRAVADDPGTPFDLRRLVIATCLDDARGIIDLLRANEYRRFRACGRDGR